jgi:hypothetical protein
MNDPSLMGQSETSAIKRLAAALCDFYSSATEAANWSPDWEWDARRILERVEGGPRTPADNRAAKRGPSTSADEFVNHPYKETSNCANDGTTEGG